MEFIKRNVPVLIIGLITIMIFMGIIIVSQKNPSDGPALKEVNKEGLISSHNYIKGDINAPVALVEFSDFQCPACKAFASVVNDLANQYPTQLKIVYRHFPLPQHQYARKAAEASQVAGSMGKFWEYVDIIFENQEKIDEKSLIQYAQNIGLDVEKFKTELRNGSYASQVSDDLEYGKSLGVNSTPTFYLNGKKLNISQYDVLIKAVRDEVQKYTTTIPDLIDIKQQTESAQTQKELPDIVINFTKDGFDQNDINAKYGQLIKWVNKTDSDMLLIQTVKKFDELNSGVTIKPEESYELRLFSERLWVYKEQNSDKYGQIFIEPKPQPKP